MPRKKMIDELEEIQEVEEIELKSDDFVVEYDKKPEVMKKAYKVILITKSKVVYESSPGNGASTKNIWGDKLKPGDTIYLEE